MKLFSLEDALEVFLERPTPSRFVRLREMVVEDADYRPLSSTLLELTDLLRSGEHDLLLCRVAESMPAWVLCPRVHFLAGCAAEALGDFEEVDLRRFLTTACVEGIRNSGDGSRKRPWLATYPSDIQDCLTSLGLSVESQQLAEGDDMLLDVVAADDGASYWFDAGEMVTAGGELTAPTSLASRG